MMIVNGYNTIPFASFANIDKTTFTASINKWQSNGMGDWMGSK